MYGSQYVNGSQCVSVSHLNIAAFAEVVGSSVEALMSDRNSSG